MAGWHENRALMVALRGFARLRDYLLSLLLTATVGLAFYAAFFAYITDSSVSDALLSVARLFYDLLPRPIQGVLLLGSLFVGLMVALFVVQSVWDAVKWSLDAAGRVLFGVYWERFTLWRKDDSESYDGRALLKMWAIGLVASGLYLSSETAPTAFAWGIGVWMAVGFLFFGGAVGQWRRLWRRLRGQKRLALTAQQEKEVDAFEAKLEEMSRARGELPLMPSSKKPD